MNRKAVAAVLAAFFVVGIASAQDAERKVQALRSAQYPLLDAIRMAEKQGGGPAIDAKFNSQGKDPE